MGANHEVNSPKISQIFLHDDGAAKTSFQNNPKRFQKVATEFKKNYLTEFSTD